MRATSRIEASISPGKDGDMPTPSYVNTNTSSRSSGARSCVGSVPHRFMSKTSFACTQSRDSLCVAACCSRILTFSGKGVRYKRRGGKQCGQTGGGGGGVEKRRGRGTACTQCSAHDTAPLTIPAFTQRKHTDKWHGRRVKRILSHEVVPHTSEVAHARLT